MSIFEIDLDAVRFRAAELDGGVKTGLETAGATLAAADIGVVESAGELSGLIDGDSQWALQQWQVGHSNLVQATELIAREMRTVAENTVTVDGLAAADAAGGGDRR